MVAVCVIAWIVNGVEDYNKGKKIPIPFKESMDLLNVPVVTFMNNGVKLHFLLDTGGDYSYIDKAVLPVLKVKDLNTDTIKVTTGSGSTESEGKATLEISYLDHVFEETFIIQDLKDHLERAFGPYGVTVHGVLGSVFFSKYKYEINYEDLTAYSKK